MNQQAHTDRYHAALAPSSAGRWRRCPGSVTVEANYPATSNAAADEGTAAHELAAHCLRNTFDPARFLGRIVDITVGGATPVLPEAVKKPTTKAQFLVTDEMVEAVEGFIELVQSVCGNHAPLVETRVHASAIHKDCWGTADVLHYDQSTKTLHCIDLKYGRGVVVEAKDNDQLKVYLSACASTISQQPDKFVGHIYQPRASHRQGPHRKAEYSREDMLNIEFQLGDAAKTVGVARTTYGMDSTDRAQWEAAYLRAGDHCRFCKHSASCSARRNLAVEVAQTEFGDTTVLVPPDKMGPEDMARTLRFARQLQHWINDVEEYANAEANAGRPPAGFKLVAGKPGNRAWKDTEQLVAALPMIADIEEDDMYEPPQERKLLSPAKMERVLAKEDREYIRAFIQRAPGKSQLVPEDDPRPAIRPDAETEFTNQEGS